MEQSLEVQVLSRAQKKTPKGAFSFVHIEILS